MRHYAGWHEDNEYFITMKEIHSDFFECLLEHVGRIEPEYGFGEWKFYCFKPFYYSGILLVSYIISNISHLTYYFLHKKNHSATKT